VHPRHRADLRSISRALLTCAMTLACLAGGVSSALAITPATERIFGAGRVETAVEASKRAYPTAGSARTIVLATGWNWPDALGGASLAGAYDGPLLLTKPDTLSSGVLAEARRLDATRVVILGSSAAVSAAVETALKGAVINSHGLAVSRIGGAGRYDTAARIASATVDVLKSRGRTYDGVAFFASGTSFSDSLAAFPISASKRWPILLVKSDGLQPQTEVAITKLGVRRGVMLGSTRAVSAAVETSLTRLLPAAPSRLAGADRYSTSIAIARFGVANGLRWDGVAIASGWDFPDAMAGGVMQGKLGSVVLLTPGSWLHPAVRAELAAHKAEIGTVRFLGSTMSLRRSVSDAVVAALR
jgi:putative cell wall-binding protein